MIRIILHLTFDRRGRRLHDRFVTTLNGQQLCVSREPLLAAARVLVAEGADPDAILAIRHAGASYDAMTAPIGAAAKWTVRESDRRGPEFRRWEPHPRVRVRALVRLNAPPLSDTEQTAERIHDGAAP